MDKEELKDNIPTEIQTLSIPLKSATIPNEVRQKKKGKDANLDYIPFGSDNLFPQVWELQMRNSVVSRSIIKDKVTYTMGDGLSFVDSPELEKYALEINSRGQSLEDVLALVYRDKYSSNNGWFEVIKIDGALIFFHKDWTTCRYEKKGKSVLIHPDWVDYENTKTLRVEIPLYPEFGKVKESHKDGAEDLPGERSMVHLKDYEAEFNFYGLPDAIAAKNAIAIGYATTGWNKSRIENGMNVSGILMLSGKYSDAQAKKVKKDVEAEFTGVDNQGKVFTIVKESGTDGRTENTEFVQVGTASDGDWDKLSDSAQEEMLMGFNWKRTLTSFDTATGFDTDRILNEYYIASSTVIIPEQRVVLGKFKKIITLHSNFNAMELQHINKPPVPLFMIMNNPDSAFRKGEVRESAGLEWDQTDKTQNEYLNGKTNGTNNSSEGN